MPLDINMDPKTKGQILPLHQETALLNSTQRKEHFSLCLATVHSMRGHHNSANEKSVNFKLPVSSDRFFCFEQPLPTFPCPSLKLRTPYRLHSFPEGSQAASHQVLSSYLSVLGWITLQSAPTPWGRTQQMEAWVLKAESSGPIVRETAITSKRGLILCAQNFIRIVFPWTRNHLSESLILKNTGLLSPASPARPSPRNLLWVTRLPKPRELPTEEDSAVNICQGENIKLFWRWYRG